MTKVSLYSAKLFKGTDEPTGATGGDEAMPLPRRPRLPSLTLSCLRHAERR